MVYVFCFYSHCIFISSLHTFLSSLFTVNNMISEDDDDDDDDDDDKCKVSLIRRQAVDLLFVKNLVHYDQFISICRCRLCNLY